MAKLVTRTFTVTEGKALVLNIATATPETIEFTVSGALTGDALMKAVGEKHNKPGQLMVCHIVESTVKDVLRGMTEEDFIQYSKVLPPRKVYDKPDNT